MRIWGGFHGNGGNPKQIFFPTKDTKQYQVWEKNGDIGNPLFCTGSIT